MYFSMKELQQFSFAGPLRQVLRLLFATWNNVLFVFRTNLSFLRRFRHEENFKLRLKGWIMHVLGVNGTTLCGKAQFAFLFNFSRQHQVAIQLPVNVYPWQHLRTCQSSITHC